MNKSLLPPLSSETEGNLAQTGHDCGRGVKDPMQKEALCQGAGGAHMKTAGKAEELSAT